MTNTNITSFRKDIYKILENTIKFNDPVSISTKDGNAVVMSESDYNGIMETLFITAQPGMKDKITDGMKTPIEECLPENEVKW